MLEIKQNEHLQIKRQILMYASKLINGFLDLLFPPYCVICKIDGTWLCEACISEFVLIQPPVCSICGIPTEKYLCDICAQTNRHFTAARCAGIFDGKLRQAIHELKYESSAFLAPALAEWLKNSPAAQTFQNRVDVAVAAPLHKDKLAARGYNQAHEIAVRFCKTQNIRYLRDAIIKIRKTPSQTKLDRQQRIDNLSGAFSIKKPHEICDKRVLIIDDVMTTGATFNELALTLKNAGARQVFALALARDI